MPRNESGVYILPSGNPVVTGTLVRSDWANPTMSDIGSEITGSLPRNGTAGMTGPLTLAGDASNDLEAVPKQQVNTLFDLKFETDYAPQFEAWVLAASTAAADAENSALDSANCRAETYSLTQETLGYRNETLSYRNEAEGFRNEAEVFRDEAAESAGSINLPESLVGEKYKHLQVKADETGYDLVEPTSNPNMIINGSFDIWQRGDSFSLSAYEYCSDRWFTNTSNTIVSRGNTNTYGNSIRIERTSSGLTSRQIAQAVELSKNSDNTMVVDVRFYEKELTASGVAQCEEDCVLSVDAFFADSSSDTVNTVTIPTTMITGANLTAGQYTPFEVRLDTTGITPQSTNTCAVISFIVAKAGGFLAATKARFMQLKLEEGDTPTPFVPDEAAVNLYKCQRYYQELIHSFTIGKTTTTQYEGHSFSVEMRGIPVMTTPVIKANPDSSPWVPTGLSSITNKGYERITGSSSPAVGNRITITTTADAEI